MKMSIMDTHIEKLVILVLILSQFESIYRGEKQSEYIAIKHGRCARFVSSLL